MGCGASAGSPPKATTAEATVSDPPVAATWATKKEAPHGVDLVTNTGNSRQNLAKNGQGETVILLDAEDDDEIEIIYESAGKGKQQSQRNQEPQMLMRNQANGQEPPDAEMDMDSGRQHHHHHQQQKKADPLPPQQQSEAAKLAEMRKKFDNQRYSREQSAAGVAAFNDTPAVVKQPPAQARKNDAKPTTDMIMGLNTAQAATKVQQQEQTFMPGAIFDEPTPGHVPAPTSAKKKRQTHDDVESTGFDADDEKMMAEILQDFDDV